MFSASIKNSRFRRFQLPLPHHLLLKRKSVNRADARSVPLYPQFQVVFPRINNFAGCRVCEPRQRLVIDDKHDVSRLQTRLRRQRSRRNLTMSTNMIRYEIIWYYVEKYENYSGDENTTMESWMDDNHLDVMNPLHRLRAPLTTLDS